MSEKDLTKSTGNVPESVNTSSQPIPVRARRFQLSTNSTISIEDLKQYARTVEALKVAKMTLGNLSLPASVRGEGFGKAEADTYLKEGTKVSEVVYDPENKRVMAFQILDETVSGPQLLSSQSAETLEICVSPAVTEQQSPVTMKVIEGLEIVVTETPKLPDNPLSDLPQPYDSLPDKNLQNSPFLQTVVGEIEKAA